MRENNSFLPQKIKSSEMWMFPGFSIIPDIPEFEENG
jgi:hypothetical protein